MKKVLVTGSSGFIGRNLCAQLELDKNIQLFRYDRMKSLEEQGDIVTSVDFVFHLAGVNRPRSDEEFTTGNVSLTEALLKKIEESGKEIPVLYTSSIQAGLDNPYGNSKKKAEDTLVSWSKKNNIPVFIFRLPNVFGKWCRPNYNSVVATFCNNIALDQSIQINDPSTKLELVYIDDVITGFIHALKGDFQLLNDGLCHISPTYNTTLRKLADKIKSFHAIRSTLIVPSLENAFDRALYATYTSYLAQDDFGYALEIKRDERGWLTEFVKSNQFGQVFVSKTKPGISRGNHWHHTKIEKFLVVEGTAEIKFRNYSSRDVIKYEVSGEYPTVIDIPAGYIHSITNVGEEDLLTIFWSDEIFNPEQPDTHYEEVVK